MKVTAKVATLGSAVLLGGLGVFGASSALASDPSANGYDVNTVNDSISFPSGQHNFEPNTVLCDANADTAVGGGWILTNATSGAPQNNAYFSASSSGPVHGGAGAKDGWHVLAYVDSHGDSIGSREFEFTVYVICKTG